jgi:hypothetical protein
MPLWMETKRYGIVLKGYEPSERELGWYKEIEEYARRNRMPFKKRVIKESVPSQGAIKVDSRIWAATETKLH